PAPLWRHRDTLSTARNMHGSASSPRTWLCMGLAHRAPAAPGAGTTARPQVQVRRCEVAGKRRRLLWVGPAVPRAHVGEQGSMPQPYTTFPLRCRHLDGDEPRIKIEQIRSEGKDVIARPAITM